MDLLQKHVDALPTMVMQAINNYHRVHVKVSHSLVVLELADSIEVHIVGIRVTLALQQFITLNISNEVSHTSSFVFETEFREPMLLRRTKTCAQSDHDNEGTVFHLG